MAGRAQAVDAVLLDIDGVLTVDWRPLPGAADAVEALRSASIPFRFCTNTTSLGRVALAEVLTTAGISCEADEILSAPVATAAHLRAAHPGRRCWLLTEGDVTGDLDGVELVDRPEDAEVIVLGGAGPAFTYDLLDRAFRRLVEGAAFVVMHRNLTWRVSDGLALDSGAFVLGLEAASGITPTVVGKPSGAFYAAAVSEVGVPSERAVMVGDDLEADVHGAQAAGLRAVLVRTGKFRPSDLERPGAAPDAVLDSVGDLAGWLSEDRSGS
jgi:HAD superfamily hydrolase (TIGR01458 family)